MSDHVIVTFISRLQDAFLEGDGDATAKAVEADNVRVLQALYQAIALGDLRSFADLLEEDVAMEIVGPPSVPFLGAWRGREQVADAVRANYRMVEEQQPELHSVVAQGDTVVATGREQGRNRATGQAYDIQFVQWHTFNAGRLIRMRQLVADTQG